MCFWHRKGVTMRYLYNGSQAKAIDSHSIHTVGIPGLVLMERAAVSAAAVIAGREEKSRRILSVCGLGNNGGDGVATARILSEVGYCAAVTVVGEPEHMSADMKRQLEIASGCGIPVLPLSVLAEQKFDVVIDAVFGIGLTRPVEGVYKKIVGDINKSGATIYALDIPSGVEAATGAVLGTAVKADCTVTFGVNKTGLVLYPGCGYAGEVLVADIGFPKASVDSVESSVYHYEWSDWEERLPDRPAYSHKGTFGKILVLAGCETMCGAAFLAAKAAYTVGAGLVKVLSTPNNRNPLLSSLPEILFGTREELEESLEWADAIIIGPGLGISEESEHMVRYVIENSPVPTVIDGDGIRLCRRVAQTLSDNFVLTPHLKEFSYLTGETVGKLREDIIENTRRTASDWHCAVVAKDARTIVSDGKDCYVNISGNNGMATGGSGDVLSGIIGGLLGQNMDSFEAAKLGVYLHGLSGDAMAAKKSVYSLTASDIIDGIPAILAGQGGIQ